MQEKAVITTRLGTAPTDTLDVNPNVAELYRAKVRHLAAALEDPQAGLEARDAIRSLVGEVVLTPGLKRGEINATLCGDLAAILALSEQKKNSGDREVTGVITTMVAGARNQRYLRLSEAWL